MAQMEIILLFQVIKRQFSKFILEAVYQEKYKKIYTMSKFANNARMEKYSLNQQDQMCSICPYSAKKCQSSSIQLKKGYWRKNNITDIIVICDQDIYTFQPQDPNSKVDFFKLQIKNFLFLDYFISKYIYQNNLAVNKGMQDRCVSSVIKMALFGVFNTSVLFKRIVVLSAMKIYSYLY
ncbi:hypothetical protein ABPG72_000420 [Tetrahymena utriculariae]